MAARFRRFHRDERGLESLQVVLILALAAIILALLKWLWPVIQEWFKRTLDAAIKSWDAG